MARRSTTKCIALVCFMAVLIVGCSQSGTTGERSAAGVATPHIDAAMAAMRTMESTTGSDSLEGVAWSFSDTDSLPDGWLVQTHSCFGATICDNTAEQARLTNAIRDIVASGVQLVDLSGLAKLPDGGFRAAIVEGVRRLQASDRRPTIRLLWGNTPGYDIGNTKLRAFHSELQSAAPDLDIVVATSSTTPVLNGYQWNHSKIVAADGRRAFVSGINMWTNDYLRADSPVTDVGMIIDGPAAAAAQRFLSAQWREVCANLGSGLSYVNNIAPSAPEGGCPSTVTVPSPPGDGSIPVLAVGRLGYTTDGKTFARNPTRTVPLATALSAQCLVPPQPNPNNGDPGWDGRNPSDTAIRALIGSAKDNVLISGQDLVFSCGIRSEDIRLFEVIADRIVNGVAVTIIVSNPDAKPSGSIGILEPEGSYAGPDVPALRALIVKYVAAKVGAKSASDMSCRLLTVAPLRVNASAMWPGQTGSKGQPGLHTKLYMVDDEAFYIGSQNLYPNQLAEFGYIVEDRDATMQIKQSLVDPMVEWSSAAKAGC